MPESDIDFSPHLDTRITVFVSHPTLKQHVDMSLKALGFHQVTVEKVPQNYFQALARAVPIIAGGSDMVLLHLPEKPQSKKEAGDQVKPIYEELQETYSDLKIHLSKRTGEPLKLLSKTVPMVEVGDYLREKLIDVLFKFRVPAAFFMSAAPAIAHLKGAKKEKQIQENFRLHHQEIVQYLGQYFRDKDELVVRADEKLSEQELNRRKREYDELMAQAEEMKEKGDFENAITVLRKAIEVFPKDIEAYLESGRLYTRRREYGRALARFGQAEDLFEDAPAPNREIANVRLTQVKEMVEAGANPQDPKVLDLLEEAAGQFKEAHQKSVEMMEKAPESPELNQPATIGQEILKWNLAEILGHKHPVVKQMHALARETTEGLESTPLSELSSMQSLAMGLMAYESGDVSQAVRYYFNALKDRERFPEVCTEINLFGIKLRANGHVEQALAVYKKLLKYDPPNMGSVFWNMAVAYAHKAEKLNAAGYAARSIYTVPHLAKEKEFYATLIPQLTPIAAKLVKTLRLIHTRKREMRIPPALVKMIRAQEELLRRIRAGETKPALNLALKIIRQSPKFAARPEFYGDDVVPAFLKKAAAALAKQNNPARARDIKTIRAYLKHIDQRPAPAWMVKYLNLSNQAVRAMEDRGDQALSAYYLGQSLVVLPEEYLSRPEFYARETLPDLAAELLTKFRFVDLKRFPRRKTAVKRKSA